MSKMNIRFIRSVFLTLCMILSSNLCFADDSENDLVYVKILSINDFHGQIGTGKKVSNRPVGSAPVLASYLEAAQEGFEDRCLIVHAGDFIGASPAASALLQDEPSVMFFNMLGNEYCSASYRLNPLANLIGTIGNHEMDEGLNEMLRLVHGGNHANGPFLQSPYEGANFPYICANIVDVNNHQPVLLPYVIKQVDGIPIAFIGVVLKDTPTMVTPSGVAGLEFQDEVQCINKYAQLLSAEGVHSIIVLLHLGGSQSSYDGLTDPNKSGLTGDALDIISSLDDDVDVVLSGHSHSFSNAIVLNGSQKEILVTQAWSAGTAYADVLVGIDPATRDIVSKDAMIVTTYADEGPGLNPDPNVAALLAEAENYVGPIVNQVVGTAQNDITRTANGAGEEALGNLIADAMISQMAADFAFMNPGGIRADIYAGEVTWGDLQTVQPFNNYLVRMNLTGQQIYDILEQQWVNQPYTRMLQIAGLTYTWDNNLPEGSRIVEVRKDGVAINLSGTYSIVTNNYLSDGGDNFSVFTQGTDKIVGPIDLDALVDYVKTITQPFTAQIEGRITRLN